MLTCNGLTSPVGESRLSCNLLKPSRLLQDLFFLRELFVKPSFYITYATCGYPSRKQSAFEGLLPIIQSLVLRSLLKYSLWCRVCSCVSFLKYSKQISSRQSKPINSKKSIFRSERDLAAFKMNSISFHFSFCNLAGSTSIKPFPWLTSSGTCQNTICSPSSEDEEPSEFLFDALFMRLACAA